MVYSDNNEELINIINQQIELEKNVLVLGRTRNLEKYNTNKKIDMGESLEEISRNLFSLLREADKFNADIIIIEGVKGGKSGIKILDNIVN